MAKKKPAKPAMKKAAPKGGKKPAKKSAAKKPAAKKAAPKKPAAKKDNILFCLALFFFRSYSGAKNSGLIRSSGLCLG